MDLSDTLLQVDGPLVPFTLLNIWDDPCNLFERSIHAHNLRLQLFAHRIYRKKTSCQMAIPTINSKFSSVPTKGWASLIVDGTSVQTSSTFRKVVLIWGVWYQIGCTLFIRLSHRILDKGLTVNFGTLWSKTFHLLVEHANNAYIYCITPKNKIEREYGQE